MKPGDKVIVARRQAFTTQRKPMLGTFAGNLGEGRVAVWLPGEDHPSHFGHTEVRPYTEALWAAWQQWLRNAKAIEEQQRQLCRTDAGRVADGWNVVSGVAAADRKSAAADKKGTKGRPL